MRLTPSLILLFVGALAPLSLIASPPSDGLHELTVRVEEGLINLSRAEVKLIGVGTPRLLSPTGGLAREALDQVARRDLLRRLTSLQGRLQEGLGARAPTPDGLAPCSASQLEGSLTQARPLRFSDGSVHLPLTLALSALWCPTSSTSTQRERAPQKRRLALTLRHPLPRTLAERPKLFGEGATSPHPLHLTHLNVSGAAASPPEGAVAAIATPHPQRKGAYLITSREGVPLALTPHDELWVWLSAPAQ